MTHGRRVRLICKRGLAVSAFQFTGFPVAVQQMAGVCVAAFHLAAFCQLKAFFGTGMSFEFRHCIVPSLILLGRRGGKEHLHAPPLQLRRFFHHSLRQCLCEALLHFKAKVGVRHFTAPEANGYLHLIAFGQEFPGLPYLGVEVVRIDIERKADLFDVDDLLVFPGFFIPFLQLETAAAPGGRS